MYPEHSPAPPPHTTHHTSLHIARPSFLFPHPSGLKYRLKAGARGTRKTWKEISRPNRSWHFMITLFRFQARESIILGMFSLPGRFLKVRLHLVLQRYRER
jgi:hypothetical protein